MAELSELEFVNLYVRVDPPPMGVTYESSYSPIRRRGRQAARNIVVPEEYDEAIDMLRVTLVNQDRDEFSFEHDGMRLRGARQICFGGSVEVALRRFTIDMPDLENGGFRPQDLEEFRSWGLRPGLIVVGGATSAGKTTTCVSLLMDYLKTHGGVLYTVEDPVEYLFPDRVGAEGKVIQVEVERDEEWGEAVKKALRFKPDFIMLGEVRTPEAARHLLRAATSGHLVICTVHGGSVEETLGAVLQIAERAVGESAYALLADGLTAVVHQSIVQGRPQIQILRTEAGNVGDPIRATIRSKRLQMLGTAIDQQATIRKQAAPVSAQVQQRPVAPPPIAVQPKKKGFFGN